MGAKQLLTYASANGIPVSVVKNGDNHPGYGKQTFLDPRDKAILRTYVRDVSKVAEELRAAEAAAKSDREASAWYRDKAEILEFVNADVLDTIERL